MFREVHASSIIFSHAFLQKHDDISYGYLYIK